MKIDNKVLQDIQQINSIENTFFRDLLALLYFPSPFEIEFSTEFRFSINFQNSFAELWDWYDTIKALPTPNLTKYLPLGKYAEELMLFYLTHSKNLELLANNLQLIDEKITIGEVDYLLKEADSSKYYHLEFAIKFYLKTTRHGEQIWLGPSTKDWLNRKVMKLTEHQMKLGKSKMELFPKALQRLNFQPKVCIKGMRFYPWREYEKLAINSLSVSWWICVDDIENLRDDGREFSIIDSKINWIFPYLNSLAKVDFVTLSAEVSQLLFNRNELRIVRYDKFKNPIDNGFIVRKNWPN